MTPALTVDQVDQVVDNTLLVLLVRPDLLPEWQANLRDLLDQVKNAALDEESLFLAAVLTLLSSPEDMLPTGTSYDNAWSAIMTGIQTGIVQSHPAEDQHTMTLDRLLNSVVQAAAAVLTAAPEQKNLVREEIADMHRSAKDAGVHELAAWLSDVLTVMDDHPIHTIEVQHQGVYAVFWDAFANKLGRK
ncbi:MAG: hypothetical protein JW966_11125 [Anaerolineae bacterium]|nr:hypothetical protein [Anaerolineae bacterium]